MDRYAQILVLRFRTAHTTITTGPRIASDKLEGHRILQIGFELQELAHPLISLSDNQSLLAWALIYRKEYPILNYITWSSGDNQCDRSAKSKGLRRLRRYLYGSHFRRPGYLRRNRSMLGNRSEKHPTARNTVQGQRHSDGSIRGTQ